MPAGKTRRDTIADGTSNTILFAEKYGECSYWALTSGLQVPWYLANAHSGFEVSPEPCDPALPQTPHRQGMHVAMADASVRLVNRSLHPATWYAANTPAGGEELGSGPYADWLP